MYEECLLRTLTGGNILMMTFTPLSGMTELLKTFYEGQFKPGDMSLGKGKYVVQVSMNECPHLKPDDVEEILASCHPSQRDARRMGIPELGAGSIYPLAEKDILVEPFEIPVHYKRLYGMDVGWHNTAAVWIAIDPDTNTKYVYAEYKKGQVEPTIHAAAIKAKGHWIPGIIDSAASGSAQADGRKLMEMYEEAGLRLENANKAVSAGIFTCYDGMARGEIKIFSNLSGFLDEFREYKFGKDGKPLKVNDHLMDAFRYAIMKADRAITRPVKSVTVYDTRVDLGSRTGW